MTGTDQHANLAGNLFVVHGLAAIFIARLHQEIEHVILTATLLGSALLGEEFVANRPRSVRLGALIPLLQGTRKSTMCATALPELINSLLRLVGTHSGGARMRPYR